jgi:protein tyrosine phosphatase (PTP) superfamily phosphohydrolase (DUF442 family)
MRLARKPGNFGEETWWTRSAIYGYLRKHTDREHAVATSSMARQFQTNSTARTRPRVPIGSVAVLATLVCALGFLWVLRRPCFQENLGVVDPGKVIRSAQPTAQLGRWVRDYHLESILNLRGGAPADWWYADELRTAEQSGLAFYDLPLSATRRPTRTELLTLIDVLERCHYPLLIHCKSGADRTGLAAALYRMVRRGEPPQQAEGAFSIEYGHVPIGGTEHLHEPLDEYAAWLKANQLPHTAERFRAWVKKDYRAKDPSAEPPLLQPGPRGGRS